MQTLGRLHWPEQTVLSFPFAIFRASQNPMHRDSSPDKPQPTQHQTHQQTIPPSQQSLLEPKHTNTFLAAKANHGKPTQVTKPEQTLASGAGPQRAASVPGVLTFSATEPRKMTRPPRCKNPQQTLAFGAGPERAALAPGVLFFAAREPDLGRGRRAAGHPQRTLALGAGPERAALAAGMLVFAVREP